MFGQTIWASTGSIRKQTGADLIYYNEAYHSFVIKQSAKKPKASKAKATKATKAAKSPKQAANSEARAGSKKEFVLKLLRRDQGATIADIASRQVLNGQEVHHHYSAMAILRTYRRHRIVTTVEKHRAYGSVLQFTSNVWEGI